MKKNLTLIFNHFEQEHLGKDVFLVPYYLGKYYNYTVTIVYPKTKTNKNLPNYINGIKLIPIKCIGNSTKKSIIEFNLLRYLFIHARNIDCLMRFHNTHLTALNVCIYKILNPSGQVYVKMDINPSEIDIDYEPHSYIKRKLLSILYKRYIQGINVISCETTSAYKKLMQTSSFFYNFKEKLIYMPNGFDEEFLKSLNMQEYSFNDKENIIITVGRLGSKEKNTGFLLEALSQIELKNWKVYLIGPIQPEFQAIIKNYFQKYPSKKNNIIFTGEIYNKEELWNYYNRSKVFVLTSKYESYALVLNEAKRFRNYIISTNVGAASDLIENNKYGIIIKQNSTKELKDVLENIINNDININVYNNFQKQSLSWNEMIKNIRF